LHINTIIYIMGAINNTHTNDKQLDPPTHTNGAAITYNLRSRRQHQHTIKTHKKKKEIQRSEHVAHHAHHQPKPNHTPIKRSSVAQAPPHISMAFPTPCSMPHKTPSLPTTLSQPTLERFFTRNHTTDTLQPANPNRDSTPTQPHKATTTSTYRHPAIHAVTFNTRGMHNTILIGSPPHPQLQTKTNNNPSHRNQTQPYKIHMERLPKRLQTHTYTPKT
jgi:hypothetical protein